jgi:hypothetical protein
MATGLIHPKSISSVRHSRRPSSNWASLLLLTFASHWKITLSQILKILIRWGEGGQLKLLTFHFLRTIALSKILKKFLLLTTSIIYLSSFYLFPIHIFQGGKRIHNLFVIHKFRGGVRVHFFVTLHSLFCYSASSKFQGGSGPPTSPLDTHLVGTGVIVKTKHWGCVEKLRHDRRMTPSYEKLIFHRMVTWHPTVIS